MDRIGIRTFIDELEAEVNNGGFHQYFYNSAGHNPYPDDLTDLLQKYNAR